MMPWTRRAILRKKKQYKDAQLRLYHLDQSWKQGHISEQTYKEMLHEYCKGASVADTLGYLKQKEEEMSERLAGTYVSPQSETTHILVLLFIIAFFSSFALFTFLNVEGGITGLTIFDAFGSNDTLTVGNDTVVVDELNETIDAVVDPLEEIVEEIIEELPEETSESSDDDSVVLFVPPPEGELGVAAAPTHGTPILNSTQELNRTAENLTAFNVSTADGDGDPVLNIINWYRNDTSITVIHTPFEGGSNGSFSRDYSDHDNNAIVHGATFNATGGYDGRGSYEFDGDDDYINFSADPTVNTSVFSVSVWVKPNTTDITQHIATRNTTQAEHSWAIQMISGIYRTNVGGAANLDNSVSSEDEWAHVVLVFNGTNQTIYVNGGFGGSNGVGSYDTGANGPVRLGALGTSSGSYNGSIDNFMLFNISLSEEQITALYENRTDFISSTITQRGDRWNASITPNDGGEDGTTRYSTSLTINTLPTQSNPILNSTLETNFTSENLTAFNISSADDESDSLKNIYNWYVDDFPIAVLHMPFEAYGNERSVAQDYSGLGNNGTVSNSTLVSWIEGGHDGFGAYRFTDIVDESNISINNPSFDRITAESFTLSLWFSKNDSDNPVLFSQVGGGGTGANWLGLENEGSNCGAVVISTGLGGSRLCASTALLNDTWYHAAVTSNTTDVTIYLNGVEERTNTTSSDQNADGPFLLGASRNGAFPFNGTLDDVMVFNRSLSPEQIVALFNNRTDLIVTNETSDNDVWNVSITPNDGKEDGTALTTAGLTIFGINDPPTHATPILNSSVELNMTVENITAHNISTADVDGNGVKNIVTWYKDNTPIAVLHMPFEGGSNATFTKDYSGFENNGTVVGATWNNMTGYDDFGSYTFDGSGDYINASNDTSLYITGNITVMTWINISTAVSGSSIIAFGEDDDGVDNEETNVQYSLNLITTSGTDIILGHEYSAGSDELVTYDANLNDSTYYHLAFTRDATAQNYSFYLNGVLIQDTNYSNPPTGGENASLYVGTNIGTNTDFNGVIDDVMVFNRSLSSDQILAFYNNLTNRIVEQETMRGELWNATITPNDATEDGTALTAVGLTINTLPTQGTPILNSSLEGNLTSENLTVFNISSADSEGDAIKNIYNWYEGGTSITVFNAPFETTGNAFFGDPLVAPEYDYSGFGNNFTNGATWVRDGGYDGKGALSFGASDIGSVSDSSLQLRGNVSYMAWVNITSITNNASIFIVADGSESEDDNLLYGFTLLSSGDIEIGHEYNSGQDERYNLDLNLSTDTWYHLAAVRDVDENVYSFYLDGQFFQNTSYTNDPSGGTSIALRLGRNPESNEDYLGMLDEVLIFNRSLSGDQIQAIYDNKTDTIVSQETTLGDSWSATITPTDGKEAGTTTFSNTLNIQDNSSSLALFDVSDAAGGDVDVYATQQAKFFANYTNSSSFINTSSSGCNITFFFNGDYTAVVDMTFNDSSTLYEFNRTFSNSSFIPYNVSCFDTFYDAVNATENITILNSIPTTPTLFSPTNGNTTLTNRSPMLLWNNSQDTDALTTLTYQVQVSNESDFSELVVDLSNIAEGGGSSTNVTITPMLNTSTLYYWRVRASDSANFSNYSSTFNFTILEVVDCSLSPATVDFGNITRNSANDTTDDAPAPLVLTNDGNIRLNISLYADWLWTSTDPAIPNPPNLYYQFMIDEVEDGSFTDALNTSLVNLTNISSAPHEAIQNLDWQNVGDAAQIEVAIRAPDDEPSSAKNSTMTFGCDSSE